MVSGYAGGARIPQELRLHRYGYAVFDKGGTNGLVVVKFSSGESGIIVAYHSGDGGKIWSSTRLSDALSIENLSNIAFAETKSGWAVVDGSLYKTANGGVSWSPVQVDNAFASILKNDPQIVQMQFASDLTGMMIYTPQDGDVTNWARANDGGKTWTVSPCGS